MWLSGWAHQHSNGRYIGSTGVARIKATSSFDAYDFVFENAYLDTSVTNAVIGEDTGAQVASSIRWIGDTSQVSSTIATVFRYTEIINNTRVSLTKELALSGQTYLGQTTTATPGVGNTDLGGAIAANGRTLHLSNSGNASLYINRNTSDGTVSEFRRPGGLVGSISVTTTATA